MATLPVPNTLSLLLLLFFFLFITSLPLSFQTSILTPIQKDHSTHQYTTTVSLKTPPQPTKLTVDLGAPFSWINCQDNYTSTTYRLVPCESALCYSLEHLACSFCYEPPGPNCGNNTCSLSPENPISNNATVGDAMVDYLAIATTDGSNQGPLTLIPNFVFSCAKTYLLKDLAKGVTGMLALGWSNNSLPLQMSRDLSRPNIFALCLSGSRTGSGVGFYGLPGPYNFLPGVDLSKSLTYTPLVINPFSDTIISYFPHASYKYFIGVTGIKINGQDVAVNKTLLAIDPNSGVGGTRISTVRPYTVLETSIYKVVTDAFAKAAATLKLKAVGPHKPFGLCYDANSTGSTIVGPSVPTIDLVLQSEDVFWRIYGSNSMVRIKKKHVDAWCLGIMDGGTKTRPAIEIGGLQLEDNLLQFDLDGKRLGFSSSVLARRTTCANFNFTVNGQIN